MSKAMLTYARGMNLETVSSAEIEVGDNWFRIEAYRENGSFHYAGFTRIGAYWKQVVSDKDARDPHVEVLRLLHAMGQRLVARARIADGEIAFSAL